MEILSSSVLNITPKPFHSKFTMRKISSTFQSYYKHGTFVLRFKNQRMFKPSLFLFKLSNFWYKSISKLEVYKFTRCLKLLTFSILILSYKSKFLKRMMPNYKEIALVDPSSSSPIFCSIHVL